MNIAALKAGQTALSAGLEFAHELSIPCDTLREVGKFIVRSGNVRVSDPNFESTGQYAHVVPAKSGEWTAFIGYDENIHSNAFSFIQIVHESAQFIPTNTEEGLEKFLKSDCDVGVNSAMAGFFDDLAFRQLRLWDDRPTYQNMMNSMDEGTALLEHGVVCSSGYGNGCYDLFVKLNDEKEVVVMMIGFCVNENYNDDEGGFDDGVDEGAPDDDC